jgi:SpoVK/Ycf46/Vps4 family AAA+-type ATPase
VFSPALRKVMHRAFNSREEWISAIVGPSLMPTRSWEDFEHLGAVRELAARVIEGTENGEDKGINILLHGPVGTGKTEFCKVLAARTGKSIWSIGESDDDGGEPHRVERLASLRLAQHLLAKRPDALILFDEAEDLIAGEITLIGTRRSIAGSKVHTNRLLEQNAVPVLWTCNETNTIDPAVLRRMTLALEIKIPSQPVRARIWRRVSAETNLRLDEPAISRLAKTYSAPPGVAINAARAAMLAAGGITEIEDAMAGILRLLDIPPALADADASDFDLALTNCRDDLPGLIERLAAPEARRNWSLCLYGAPGTGKSKFARYLAAKLGMEVVQHRVSDLYSKWVGDSEKQIAAAFAAARAQRRLLVFDEADSLLQDRRNAVRTWEITHVNEMLTWMESHPLPLVCTTNLMDNLDPASLRRFTFKLRFDTMTRPQAALAFERFFGMPVPGPLPDGLTPGDYAVVRRKAELLGVPSPATLVEWLKEEVSVKGLRTAEIGFRLH